MENGKNQRILIGSRVSLLNIAGVNSQPLRVLKLL